MTEFKHQQAAHCESGVTASLLQHVAWPVSEPMAFGIGSGLFFGYVPFIKVMGLPLTTFRSFPGTIFKKTCKRLHIPFTYQSFRDPQVGRRTLDENLRAKRAVGVRGNIYWLPYIPEAFRFQFNAHHFVVYDQSADGEYAVSDPVLSDPAICPSGAMNKSRFSRGPLAPKGLMFYPHPGVEQFQAQLPNAVHAGIRETVYRMVGAPPPFGVRGMRYLARHMRRWPRKLDVERRKLYLANVVRMQEEIGTGGAGFRFLYAAFLQEAGDRLQRNELNRAAESMTAVGNLWREFATLAAKFCKDRLQTPYEAMPDLLLQIADEERQIFKKLQAEYLPHV